MAERQSPADARTAPTGTFGLKRRGHAAVAAIAAVCRGRAAEAMSCSGILGSKQLAALANRVARNDRTAGKIIRIDPMPGIRGHPAKHLILALLAAKGALEVAFARFHLVNGVGMITLYSHRSYGEQAGVAMSRWLPDKGPSVEKTLMTWNRMPALALLQKLPQSE